MEERSFDVIIIGAGISGLTSAALLSKQGLSVCVLERHYVIGGYLQGFDRGGFVFDTAIHWLNQCGKNGTVSRIFGFIGNDFPKAQEMKKIQRHLGGSRDYVLSNSPDDLKRKMIEDFPEDKVGIERFFSDAKKIAKVSLKYPKIFRSPETLSVSEKVKYGLRKVFIGFPLFKHIFYAGDEGMEKGLKKYFKSVELRKLFSAEQDMLSCLFPIAWAYNNDYQNPPIGGSQSYPKWLLKYIENDKDSQVILSANVTRILVDGKAFKGVRFVKRGKEYTYTAKYLIAACDVNKLYKELLPEFSFTSKQNDKIQNSDLYSSSVTLSIALNCPAEDLGFGEELTIILNDDASRLEHSSGDPYKSAISVLAPTTRDNTLAPKGKGTLTIYVPAWIDYQDFWKTEMNDKGEFVRTDDYKALKEEFANIILDRVEERMCPNLRTHIEFYEVATPITYHRYTLNKNGSMMGGRPGKKNMKLNLAHYKTPVKNVIIGGHWAELGGGVPIATKAAYNASLIVLKEENKSAYQELVNVMELD